MNYFKKRTGLLVFLIFILVAGLAGLLFVLTKPTNLQSNAQAATILSFSPNSTSSSPISSSVGSGVPLELMLSPHTNIVSFIQLELLYDPKYFTADSSSFVLNGLNHLDIREGPFFSPGKVTVSVGIGNDPAFALSKETKIATIRLKPILSTPNNETTSLRFGANTQVLSIGTSDSAAENVLSSTTPAYFVISSSRKK